MKIRLKAQVSNAYGAFKKGDVVDWPAKNAQPLVDSDAAEVFIEKPVEKPSEKPAKKAAEE